MIDPDVARAKDRDSVAVGFSSVSDVRWRRADVGVAGRNTVVDVDIVDDYIRDVLECDAAAAGDMDIGTAAI